MAYRVIVGDAGSRLPVVQQWLCQMRAMRCLAGHLGTVRMAATPLLHQRCTGLRPFASCGCVVGGLQTRDQRQVNLVDLAVIEVFEGIFFEDAFTDEKLEQVGVDVFLFLKAAQDAQ